MGKTGELRTCDMCGSVFPNSYHFWLTVTGRTDFEGEKMPDMIFCNDCIRKLETGIKSIWWNNGEGDSFHNG